MMRPWIDAMIWGFGIDGMSANIFPAFSEEEIFPIFPFIAKLWHSENNQYGFFTVHPRVELVIGFIHSVFCDGGHIISMAINDY